jgi:hypothetical protein
VTGVTGRELATRTLVSSFMQVVIIPELFKEETIGCISMQQAVSLKPVTVVRDVRGPEVHAPAEA